MTDPTPPSTEADEQAVTDLPWDLVRALAANLTQTRLAAWQTTPQPVRDHVIARMASLNAEGLAFQHNFLVAIIEGLEHVSAQQEAILGALARVEEQLGAAQASLRPRGDVSSATPRRRRRSATGDEPALEAVEP